MFWEDLSYVVKVKSTVEISQNLVALSEYMNFTTYDFRIFDMFCGGCCYPDTKEESGNQEQCSSREEMNENSKSRPDTIEHKENNTISPHLKTTTYGRNRFGTHELSSSDESVMDISIHGRNEPANISYPISLIIETQGKQNENNSASSGTGEFCKIKIQMLGLSK